MGVFKNWLERNIDLAKPESVSTIYSDIDDKLSFKKLGFYIAATYISNTIGKCEIKVFNDNKEVKDQLYYLLNVSPNINENASQFKNKLIINLLIDGEALVVQNKNNFYVADAFGVEERPFGKNLFTNITVGTETLRGNKKADEVFYFKLDSLNLKSLIDSMYEDYGQLVSYALNSYKTSNSKKYKLDLKNVKVGDKDFNEKFNTVIKQQLKDFMENPNSIYPQFEGYDLQKFEVGDGKTDSTDIRNIRKDVFETVAQAFKMPVSMLYGNMTNVKDIVNSYVTFVIDPIMKMISEEVTRKTSSFEEWSNGNYVKGDTSAIMHVDLFDIADKIDKFIYSGFYCIDELREKVGDNKLNTDFSKQHWMTKNNATIEDVLIGESDLKGGE